MVTPALDSSVDTQSAGMGLARRNRCEPVLGSVQLPVRPIPPTVDGLVPTQFRQIWERTIPSKHPPTVNGPVLTQPTGKVQPNGDCTPRAVWNFRPRRNLQGRGWGWRRRRCGYGRRSRRRCGRWRFHRNRSRSWGRSRRGNRSHSRSRCSGWLWGGSYIFSGRKKTDLFSTIT